MATSLRSPRSLVCGPDEYWPTYAQDEIDAVTDVLRSGKVNQWTGPTVGQFEAACEAAFGGAHGIALANGSLALELPLMAFGIGAGDEVIVTPRSFVASASCVRLVGATPVFADIDAASGNITAETIERVITPRTRAIIPVHLGGWPCDMPAIMALARRHGIKVIEDCAQAHGAMIGDRPVGAFGDAAAFSFCQDKIITTGGEGGYVRFADKGDYDWAWSYKDHGKNRDKVFATDHPPGFRWLHDTVGTNWRLTAMQAAIGIRQLAKLPEWTRLRTRNAGIWRAALADMPSLDIPAVPDGMVHAYYRYYFYLRDDDAALRDQVLARATECGLRVFSGSCSEVYLEHAFDDLPRPDLPVARRLGRTSLMTEIYPTLDPEALADRAAALRDIIASVA
ncbi:MAG: DegT/DnrJ/EryC1/StrS aminotransferase family protein [Pseudomonadota bacterium]|nr:DegT/DnrJ/EryC1/StrS aminotransferase family protein [Pseudomonadota bacterium]